MATGQAVSGSIETATPIRQPLQALMASVRSSGAILGPLVGLLIWLLPLDLAPLAHKALAVAGFVLTYWITKPIDYGMTALFGCVLFWTLQITSFPIAFSGFATPTPWFVFGGLLMGEAAACTGLAKRLGFLLLRPLGASYSRLSLGLVTLVWLLSFLIPPANGLIATLVPIGLGIVVASGLGPQSNLARGLFVILTYSSSLFGKMLLGGEVSVLAHGILEVQAGTHVLWSQWFLAFLPAALLSIVIIWLSIRWIYPITNYELIVVQQALSTGAQVVGPWSQQERKALLWLLLAIVLWSLDFLHHLNPAMIAISIGLILVLPKVGVLDSTSIRQVNFTVVLFIGGALAMGRVLAETQVLDILVDSLVGWLAPIMSNAWQGAVILYWSNFFFRFLLGTELTTVSTALPLWLKAAETYGYNPACIGLIWAFAGAGKLFIYQSSVLVMGYAYGFFDSRDIFKIGAILTLFEGLVLMVLVPFYWPLVGLSWNLDSAEQRVTATQAEVVLSQTSAHHISEAGRPGYDMTSPMTSTSLNVDGLDAETTAWASIRDSSDSQDFVEFLNAFPQTRFVFAARMRLRQILRR